MTNPLSRFTRRLLATPPSVRGGSRAARRREAHAYAKSYAARSPHGRELAKRAVDRALGKLVPCAFLARVSRRWLAAHEAWLAKQRAIRVAA